jgi:CRP/FNR family transcriptional regulator, cyclic AMP receptor protein
MSIRRTALRNLSLFSELTEEELTLLAALLRETHYPKNSMVFHEGESGESLLLIMKGKVKVVLLGDEGQETILSIMTEGSFFGELSVIDSSRRSASVITLEHSTFLQMTGDAFLSALRTDPNIAMKVLKNLSARVRDLTEEVRSMRMFDIYGRLIRCLVRLGQTHGKRDQDLITLSAVPNNQDLARMIGCTRESVSRAMKVLRENDFLKVVGRDLQIQERALKEYWPSF